MFHCFNLHVPHKETASPLPGNTQLGFTVMELNPVIKSVHILSLSFSIPIFLSISSSLSLSLYLFPPPSLPSFLPLTQSSSSSITITCNCGLPIFSCLQQYFGVS